MLGNNQWKINFDCMVCPSVMYFVLQTPCYVERVLSKSFFAYKDRPKGEGGRTPLSINYCRLVQYLQILRHKYVNGLSRNLFWVFHQNSFHQRKWVLIGKLNLHQMKNYIWKSTNTIHWWRKFDSIACLSLSL